MNSNRKLTPFQLFQVGCILVALALGSIALVLGVLAVKVYVIALVAKYALLGGM